MGSLRRQLVSLWVPRASGRQRSWSFVPAAAGQAGPWLVLKV